MHRSAKGYRCNEVPSGRTRRHNCKVFALYFAPWHHQKPGWYRPSHITGVERSLTSPGPVVRHPSFLTALKSDRTTCELAISDRGAQNVMQGKCWPDPNMRIKIYWNISEDGEERRGAKEGVYPASTHISAIAPASCLIVLTARREAHNSQNNSFQDNVQPVHSMQYPQRTEDLAGVSPEQSEDGHLMSSKSHSHASPEIFADRFGRFCWY